jgi:hypothetical protein
MPTPAATIPPTVETRDVFKRVALAAAIYCASFAPNSATALEPSSDTAKSACGALFTNAHAIDWEAQIKEKIPQLVADCDAKLINEKEICEAARRALRRTKNPVLLSLACSRWGGSLPSIRASGAGTQSSAPMHAVRRTFVR